MILEEFIQRAYFEVFKDYDIPFFDVLPSSENPPFVLLEKIQRISENCCRAEARVVLTILDARTSKVAIYELAAAVEKQLKGKLWLFKTDKFSFANVEVAATDTFSYTKGTNEIWQKFTFIIKQDISKRCGQKT